MECRGRGRRRLQHDGRAGSAVDPSKPFTWLWLPGGAVVVPYEIGCGRRVQAAGGMAEGRRREGVKMHFSLKLVE